MTNTKLKRTSAMNSDIRLDSSAASKIRVAINGYGVIGRR